MNFRREREEHKLERLNLVPIMDAVFIFIFFLLFSAQFIKIFEIETEAPVVSEVPENQKMDKDPLNLIVKVYQRKIEVLKGIDQDVVKTFFKDNKSYLEKIKGLVLDLRLKHPKDDYVIISPEPTIKYDEIVGVIDAVQSLPKGKVYKIRKKGQDIRLRKIFTQVVLEPIDEI